jgi:hypothetical protein
LRETARHRQRSSGETGSGLYPHLIRIVDQTGKGAKHRYVLGCLGQIARQGG